MIIPAAWENLKMAHQVLSVISALIILPYASAQSDLSGDYCRGRLPVECCLGRKDDCSVPILGTLCYCDVFCNRTSNSDCCPDYWTHCAGLPPPDFKGCRKNGKTYRIGEKFKTNCNVCICRHLPTGEYDVICDSSPCLIRPALLRDINHGQFGWKASNYSFLWGKTLDEGIRQRLGTFPPTNSTKNMPEIHITHSSELPRSFDSRQHWVRWLQPVRDQGDCGASWAFSSAALTSDRLSLMTGGLWRVDLSPQLLISCQNRAQRGCDGGHLDRAWWFLRKHGTSSERCYPYHSGKTSPSGRCQVQRWRDIASKLSKVRCVDGEEDILYFATPAYKTAPKEEAIMHEIYNNGPVQATFRVKEDFYSYRSGIYRHTKLSDNLPITYRREGWHSVRIIGWGESLFEGAPTKYWLCANSWGKQWGEDGYFRILRGENECDIESFVIGVWANLEELNQSGVLDVPRRGRNLTDKKKKSPFPSVLLDGDNGFKFPL